MPVIERLPAGVAAGHAETAEAGLSILRSGGTAADASVAMMLMACVAETMFTGLGGGGFATYYDAATGEITCLDFFVSVPGLGERSMGVPEPIEITMGGQPLPYTVGAATVAVPGVPAGAERLWQFAGRSAWADLVAPAAASAASGVRMTAQHAHILRSVGPAMCLGDGGAIHRGPDGQLLRAGDLLLMPGLHTALELIAEAGARAFYDGAIAEAMLAVTADGGALSERDLSAYEVKELAPRRVLYAGATVAARGNDLDDVLGTLARLEPSKDPVQAARNLVRAIRAEPRRAETTNHVAVDSDGNACAVTTSLGLGAGVWVPGFGVHLNSMLGEGELIRDTIEPGDRMGSMMSPLIAVDSDGPLVVAGAAGGSRIRPALVQTLQRLLHHGVGIQEAISAPRLNPVLGGVRIEPGYDHEAINALRSDGDEVVVLPALDAYFGGVSAIARDGAGADPRRGGVAALL